MTARLLEWSLLAGALLPLPLAILEQPTWAPGKRALVAAAVSLAVGFGTAWAGGVPPGLGAIALGLTVLVASSATYASLWQATGVAPALELWSSRLRRGRARGQTPR